MLRESREFAGGHRQHDDGVASLPPRSARTGLRRVDFGDRVGALRKTIARRENVEHRDVEFHAATAVTASAGPSIHACTSAMAALNRSRSSGVRGDTIDASIMRAT